MPYVLGVDLGTTFTAAAVCEPGSEPRMLSLGSNSYAVPSVVFLREDGSFLAGESAELQSSSDATRVARHFKRRLGDDTPVFLSTSSFRPEELVAELLGWVVAEASARRGEMPARLVLTHPANWGGFRTKLLSQAAASLGVQEVVLLSEPEAAAIHYVQSERVEPGEIIGVYDLGGGTFDAVIMRRTDSGFEGIGRPVGVERLGGVDFDDAIRAFVMDAADLHSLDTSREEVVASAYALQASCVSAKRVLSADTAAHVRVAFPDVNTSVRMNRAEFEDRIRPRLQETLGAFDSALASANVTADDLSRILLVGGSSRIPLVSALLSQRYGRPLAVDTDPKNTVALGAAVLGVQVPLRALPQPSPAAVEPPPPVEAPPAEPPPAGAPPAEAGPVSEAAPAAGLDSRHTMRLDPNMLPPTEPGARAEPSSPSRPEPPPSEPAPAEPLLPSTEPAARMRPKVTEPGPAPMAPVEQPQAATEVPTTTEPSTSPAEPTVEDPSDLLGVKAESGHRARIPQASTQAEVAEPEDDGSDVAPVGTDPKLLVLVALVLVAVLVVIAVVVFAG